MKKSVLGSLYLIATGQLFLAKPAQALTFNFNWRSDAPGLSILRGSPGPHVAQGTFDIDINPSPGGNFTLSDVSTVDITVQDTSNSENVFNISYFDNLSGIIDMENNIIITF